MNDFQDEVCLSIARHSDIYLCVCVCGKMNPLAGIQYKIESLIGILNVKVISKAKFVSLSY